MPLAYESRSNAIVPAMDAPAGTVTIVFTDIEDSTPLWERHGRAFEACLARHNDILRSVIAANRGFEVKTEGDAFMIAFARAGDAVEFAVQAQLKLDAEPWPADIGNLMVRMGLHTGEPIVGKDPAGRTDYFGPVVNRAARVSAAGHGGQILLSESARNAAQDAFGDALVTDLGEHSLKGLERPERLHQLLPQALAERVFAPLQTISAQQTNMPAQSSSFIGRKREITELTDMLAPRQADASAGTKLLRPQDKKPSTRPGVISLVGPGGTGKTRLALRVGSEVLDRYEGGVWFVDLSACREASEAATEVASVLGVRLAGNDDPRDAVGNVLQYRKPLLLILDNFEQLAAHSDDLVGEWRRRAPQVTFMVTTRAVLGLEGEREFELQPLAAPPDADAEPAELLKYESVALFVQRAQEADKRFTLDDKNAADVARICVDLEGIPLAVELAASRVKLMKPAQILKRLEKKFELLKSTRRDTGLRQRTLYDALEWSFDLLTDWERAAFMQASAFHGGFLLEAAEEVIDLSAFPEAPGVLDALQSLREKSLLRTDEGEFETRFLMYKPIHDFGENRLGKFGDLPPLYERHYTHFVRYAEEWSERVYSPDELEALNRLEHDRANIVIAQERALKLGDKQSAARIAIAMTEFFIVRGPADLRTLVINRAIDALGDEPRNLAVKLWVARSRSSYEVSAQDASRQEAERAVELAEGQDAAEKCIAHRQLAHAYFMLGRMKDARIHVDIAMEQGRQTGDPLTISQVTGSQGIITFGEIRPEEALPFFKEAERLAREVGYATGIANHTSNLALVLGRLDRREESLATYKISADIYRQLGNRTGIGRIVANSGAQLQMLGRLEEAREAYLEAARIQRETGHRHGLVSALGNLGAIHTMRLNDLDMAEKYLTESLALAREMGAKDLIHMNLAHWGDVHSRRGNHAKAEECLREAVEMCREMGERFRLPAHLYGLASVLAALKRWDEAEATVQESIAFSIKHGMKSELGRAYQILGHQRGAQGRVDEAAKCYELAFASFSAHQAPERAYSLGTSMQFLLAKGRTQEARELAVRVLDLAAQPEFKNAGEPTLKLVEEAKRLVG